MISPSGKTGPETDPQSQWAWQTIEEFASRYPFTLDDFQLEALRQIAGAKSVIVSAPTGAGKTLIAEFAIWLALTRHQRIGYTTPLKALSNQKYADFQRQFGEEQVGILTGDVKVNPQAPVLVMTTEILRNMFYEGEFPEMAYIVLDECHYLGDEGRGTVWEEIIINCPPEIRLVALSATVSNIREIAAWIEEVHGPIEVIYHPVRPVPLEFLLCNSEGTIVPLSGGTWRQLEQSLYRRESPSPHRGRRSRGRDRPLSLRRRPVSPTFLIPRLQARGWLPAIYFIFSRAACEQALEKFLEEGGDLLGPQGREQVEATIEEALADYPSLNLKSQVNAMLIQGLKRGIGVHHAGILPALKRLTEVLFEKGLVKVVFATETMSLGIHMPAKSVVLQGITKRTDFGFRTLTHNEITQMAGRAGRRGIDPEGKCLVALESREELAEAVRLIRGKSEPIASQFRIGYSSAALLLRNYQDEQAIRRVIESSLGQYQNRKRVEDLEDLILELKERERRYRSFQPPCQDTHNLQRYARWREKGEMDKAAELPCLQCGERSECQRHLRRLRRLERSLRTRQEELDRLLNSYWDQFLKVVEVLREFSYVRDRQLTPPGQLVASLRHDNELLVARIVFSDLLPGLKPAEMAALISCVVEEPRSREAFPAKSFLRQYPHLRRRYRQMEALADEIFQVQQAKGVFLPVSLHPNLAAAVHEWATGESDWNRLVTFSFGGHEGDLIRSIRRLIDLCRQLIDTPTLPAELVEPLWQAVEMLDRDIVWESALI